MSGVSSSLIFCSYFICRRLIEAPAGLWATCLASRGQRAPRGRSLLITRLLQNPILAAFLFSFSYYISSLVTTELTAGKDLHMA